MGANKSTKSARTSAGSGAVAASAAAAGRPCKQVALSCNELLSARHSRGKFEEAVRREDTLANMDTGRYKLACKLPRSHREQVSFDKALIRTDLGTKEGALWVRFLCVMSGSG